MNSKIDIRFDSFADVVRCTSASILSIVSIWHQFSIWECFYVQSERRTYAWEIVSVLVSWDIHVEYFVSEEKTKSMCYSDGLFSEMDLFKAWINLLSCRVINKGSISFPDHLAFGITLEIAFDIRCRILDRSVRVFYGVYDAWRSCKEINKSKVRSVVHLNKDDL